MSPNLEVPYSHKILQSHAPIHAGPSHSAQVATHGRGASPRSLVLRLSRTLEPPGSVCRDPGAGSSPGLISSALGLLQAPEVF